MSQLEKNNYRYIIFATYIYATISLISQVLFGESEEPRWELKKTTLESGGKVRKHGENIGIMET